MVLRSFASILNLFEEAFHFHSQLSELCQRAPSPAPINTALGSIGTDMIKNLEWVFFFNYVSHVMLQVNLRGHMCGH